MHTSEIVAYFAARHMGSAILNLVDLNWDKLDSTEKEMAASLKESGTCQLSIRSKLTQQELEDEVRNTPKIALAA